MPFRIALVQQRCEKAAIAQNLAGLSAILSQAALRQVDIIGFPEMNITGYADPTRFPQAVLRLDSPEIADFLQRTRSFPGVVLAGLIEHNPADKPFITQVAARQGELLGFYRKITVAEDEVAWFSPGESSPVFQHAGLTFGIAICADAGNPAVFDACACQGARIIFELAAPGLYGEQATRDWHSGYDWWQGSIHEDCGGHAQRLGCWIAVATQAGRTCDEDFPGGGFLFAPSGERVFATPDGSAGVVYLEIDLETGKAREIGG